MHSRNDDVIRCKVFGFDRFGIVGHCTLRRYRFVGGRYGRTVVFVEPRKPYVLHVVLDTSSTEDWAYVTYSLAGVHPVHAS